MITLDPFLGQAPFRIRPVITILLAPAVRPVFGQPCILQPLSIRQVVEGGKATADKQPVRGDIGAGRGVGCGVRRRCDLRRSGNRSGPGPSRNVTYLTSSQVIVSNTLRTLAGRLRHECRGPMQARSETSARVIALPRSTVLPASGLTALVEKTTDDSLPRTPIANWQSEVTSLHCSGLRAAKVRKNARKALSGSATSPLPLDQFRHSPST